MEVGDRLYVPAILFTAQDRRGRGSKNNAARALQGSNLESPVVQPIMQSLY
jgi:hypothetical protein